MSLEMLTMNSGIQLPPGALWKRLRLGLPCHQCQHFHKLCTLSPPVEDVRNGDNTGHTPSRAGRG